jgi:hypothetical protein
MKARLAGIEIVQLTQGAPLIGLGIAAEVLPLRSPEK